MSYSSIAVFCVDAKELLQVLREEGLEIGNNFAGGFKYHPEKGVFVQKVVQCFQQLVMFLCFSFVICPFQAPLHSKYSLKSPSEATFILSAAISGFIDLVIRSSTPN